MAKKRRPQKPKRPLHKSNGQRAPSLSLCMIARDEASFLRACLQSVSSLVDEILVGDTGSIDDSAEVARLFGASVLDVPWTGDFAEARNQVLAAASSDWILVMDCDEVLAASDLSVVKLAMASEKVDAYRMTTRNYVRETNRVGRQECDGSYALEERSYTGWFPTTKVRLFRNNPAFRFEGALHELVENNVVSAGGRIGDCTAFVHHYGHVEKERPVAAYGEAARRKVDAEPNSVDALYELALALRDAGDLDGAADAISGCLRLMEEGVGRCGQYFRHDFAFLVQGDISGRRGDRGAAETAYRRALEVNPECYQALNNLGAAMQKRGEFEGALDYYEKAMELAPDVGTIRENVSLLRRKLGNIYPQGVNGASSAQRWDSTPGDGGVLAEKVVPAVLTSQRPKGPTLSVCMIARNEAHRLGQCLDSVKDLADEIVVVDTGSTDDTVAVAQRYGARIGTFEWCDDFAAARNVSLEMATGDYLLWLDADDLLPPEEAEKVRGLLRKEKDRAFFFVLDSQGYEPVSCLQLRLFPNHPEVRFEMPIHEQLTPSLARAGIGCEPTDIRVVHTGYTTPDVVKEKQTRYLAIMESWLEKHPEDYIVRSHAAQTYHIQGKLDEAIEAYRQILEESDCRKDRNLVVETTSWLYLGRTLMRKQAFEEALPNLQKALELDDQYAVTWLTMSECYTRLGRTEEAIRCLASAREFEDQITFASNDPKALKYSIRFFAGQNLEEEGRLEEALASYQEAVEVDPDRSGGEGALSTIYRKLGRRDEAIGSLEKAIALDPENPKHSFNRGTFHMEEGRLDEAEHLFHAVLEKDPAMFEAYLNLGFVARKRGDAKRAERMYLKALDLNPDSVEPAANLAHMLLDQSRFVEAIEWLERVDGLQPALLDVKLGLCVAYAAGGQLDQVAHSVGSILPQIYGDGLQLPASAGLHATALSQLLSECGRMLLQQNLPVCARLAYQAAHLLDPGAVSVALQLAEVYRATGQPQEAVSVCEQMLLKQPEEPELFRKLGACYQDLNVPEAVKMCEQQVAALEAQ